MKSRLNQSNTRFALPLLPWAIPEMVGGFCALALVLRGAMALGYWVPSSPMPRSTLEQPHRGQPPATHQPVLTQRVDGVLTAGRGEPACGQPHRRNGVAVELDEEDHAAY